MFVCLFETGTFKSRNSWSNPKLNNRLRWNAGTSEGACVNAMPHVSLEAAKTASRLCERHTILGVERGSSPNEIHKTRRTLQREVHPDKGGSVKLSTLINQAADKLLSRCPDKALIRRRQCEHMREEEHAARYEEAARSERERASAERAAAERAAAERAAGERATAERAATD